MAKNKEIKEIALNPILMTNDTFENLKNQGFQVRWMNENEFDSNISVAVIYNEGE